MAYRIVSETGDKITVELTLANKNTHYVWNGWCFDIKNITFETTGKVLSIKYADGGEPVYNVNGNLVTIDLTWRGIFHLNTTVKIIIEIQKSGDNPYPHNFKIHYLRGESIIYPTIGELPASWKPGNFTLSDLIADPKSYYDPHVKPHQNGFIMYNPPHPTQIIIGLADIDYPLNLASSARMWVPNKYFAMGLALAYEWFKVNPNFLMALAAKENWGTAVTKDPAFKGYKVIIDEEEYYWPVQIDHPDGIFQVESGNFNQIKAYYPDIFPDTADHDDYMKVSLDPNDTAWITSPIVAAVSLTMERELLYAAVGDKYNEFLRLAKDPWAETEIIDFGYNRGVGAIEALKIFSDNWEKAINAEVLWKEFNMEGFGGHVPTVINITATMDMETERIYDANLTWDDIEYFFTVVRQKFFRPGAISDEEWNAMMRDVKRAYDLLSQHWGGDHISYRYDFLTILRVAMKHWPEPHIPRPTGDDWYYHARNYNP
uniref:Chitinase n=1 Tax=Thermococcus chitonophagus TaxID=54262 RepID=UPI000D50331D|nr:Chain A, Chitinase [Thermococcus chitonophagus]5XSV_B Chain B, Chitinase [Thermococcus chitonophagus]5XSV_C Chain C, Chitinase [Thermococcus chitonophagus]5XSV_D Chain D, Chitinase [Thermococcus chitonophagus]5XSW_A Chain A, Chitinase [Thermococcus chitonophagus]5XSW_B Chain B, Chitinase [Thermococcus chitonophagus]5XSX_A Chain A, Chitinase [Thermococcus chitonophagus]5XSX_B Chain B, Chitinase [Thermococcus chitonophagus]